MTDYETTPEYGAWVEARRIAVEARQDLLDFDGETYTSRNV